MLYEVKEAPHQDVIFWIEDEDGITVCDFYRLDTHRRPIPYPNAKANAEMICQSLNQREETK